METITPKLSIKTFPISITDNNGNELYYETLNGDWVKRKYDDRGNQIHFENSDGLWSNSEYDDNDDRIYYENSSGYTIDKKTKPILVIDVTMKDLEEKFGCKVRVVK